MGPEEKSGHVCYIMSGGVAVAQFEAIDGELEITLGDEGAEPLIMGAIGPLAFEMSVTLPKEWRCASRKRFIKLLMSYGCSRNDARDMATIAQAMRGQKSYQELLFEVMALFAEHQTAGKEE